MSKRSEAFFEYKCEKQKDRIKQLERECADLQVRIKNLQRDVRNLHLEFLSNKGFRPRRKTPFRKRMKLRQLDMEPLVVQLLL